MFFTHILPQLLFFKSILQSLISIDVHLSASNIKRQENSEAIRSLHRSSDSTIYTQSVHIAKMGN